MSYDFTYMWNLNKTNKETERKDKYREMIASRKKGEREGKMSESEWEIRASRYEINAINVRRIKPKTQGT